MTCKNTEWKRERRCNKEGRNKSEGQCIEKKRRMKKKQRRQINEDLRLKTRLTKGEWKEEKEK